MGGIAQVHLGDQEVLFLRSLADGPFYSEPALTKSKVVTWWYAVFDVNPGQVLEYYTTGLGNMIERVVDEAYCGNTCGTQSADDQQMFGTRH